MKMILIMLLKNFIMIIKFLKKLQQARLAKKNDRLIISYKGFIDKEQFEGGTTENQIIDLGNNNYLARI